MKILKHCWTILVLAGMFISGFAYAVDREGSATDERTLRKPLVRSAINFDGNRIDCDMENQGQIVSQNVSGRSGLTWPKGSGIQTIYAAGIWMGGKVNNQVRMSAGEFSGEFVGGPYGSDWNDAKYKLYKIDKSDLADPLANDDFQNWPVEDGAEFIDNNGNGTYEPLPNGPDLPYFIGDQVIYAIMNDGDPNAHSLFNSAPMGIEYQMTVFGFDRPDAFGDMMFVKALLINKGPEPITDMILGLWCDPDLGDASDDFVGCDTTLGMGIVYNDGGDANYAGFEQGVPAAGFDFFQGPMVPAPGETAFMFGRHIPDMRNLNMTSFTKYINPDPIYRDPNDAIEAYNYMQGLLPDGTPFDFAASGGTPFLHAGDPNLDTGPDDDVYVDADLHASDDRRFLMNAGPFVFAPGDSQEVVFGIINAASGTALESYSYLKEVDALAQLAYDIQFALPPSPPNPEVEVTAFEDEIILSWDTSAELYTALDQVDKDEDGNNTEFVFEGYNVYQIENTNGTGDVKRIATYDLVNGLTEIYDDVFDPDFGETINRRVQFGSDSGLRRSIIISADALNNGAPLLQNRLYNFAVTAYGYNPYGIPRTLESPYNVHPVRPQTKVTWETTDTTAVYDQIIDAEHTAGPSDGVAYAAVTDPTKLTGDDYELFFATENYYQNIDGVWINENAAGKRGFGKVLDCTGSEISFSALKADDGTYNLYFHFHINCGSNWVDGLVLDFPDNININSWGGVGDFSYGSAAGQNCDNMDGTLDAATNTITWGSDARSGFGCIEGDQAWVVNINPTDLPFSVDYMVYDDGYDGTIVDVASAVELGFAKMAVEGWYARNLTTGEIVTPHTTIQSGVATDNIVEGVIIPGGPTGTNAGPQAEGLRFAVDGPELGVNRVVETDAAEAVLDANVGVYPPSLGTTGYILSHRDHAGLGAGRDHDRFDAWIMDDVIIDFAEESFAWHYTAETGLGTVPYSVYRQKFPSGDRVRLFAGYWDTDESGTWSVQGDRWTDYGKPAYEPIYAWQGYDAAGNEINYDPANDAQYAADNSLLTSANTTWGGGTGAIHYPYVTATLMVLYLGDATPPWGNKIMIITNKANTAQDKFKVSTAGLLGKAKAYDKDEINVWPNPYFAFNPEERSPIEQQVHFTNLPETGKCTIRIFDLSGVPIRVLNHEEGSTLTIWDLNNENTIPVASGMYIAVVETDAGQKVFKLAVILPEQRLDLY